MVCNSALHSPLDLFGRILSSTRINQLNNPQYTIARSRLVSAKIYIMNESSPSIDLPSEASLLKFTVHFHDDGKGRTIVSVVYLLIGRFLTADVLSIRRDSRAGP